MARLEVTRVRLALRAPLRTAWGELRERSLLRVRLAWDDDDFGVGEAAPLEPYDGVPLAAVAAALQVYASVLAEADPGAGHAELLDACARERDLPQALAAIDLALWDRAGRRAGRPVAELLARRRRRFCRRQRDARRRGPRRCGCARRPPPRAPASAASR